MPMSRQTKEEQVVALAEKFTRAKAALIANYTGLNVQQVNEVRNVFRKAGVEYRVVKNTLAKRVLLGRSIEPLKEAFFGPTAVAFKFDEEYGRLGKAAKELIKKFEKFQIKAGYIEDDLLKGDIVETMAALPTLDEARAQLLGVINAPAAKLLAQIEAPASHMIGVVKAKSEKEDEGVSHGES